MKIKSIKEIKKPKKTYNLHIKNNHNYITQGNIIAANCHEAEGKSIDNIMKMLPDTHYRVGLTGTLKEAKTSELVLTARFGPKKKFISTSELMKKGLVAKLKIFPTIFDYDEEFKKELKPGYEYKDEIEFLTNCKERNNKIVQMANSLDGNTLVMFKHIDHGKYLFEELQKISKKPVYYIAGSTDKDQRELVRQLAEQEECTIVASMGVFSTGVSIKRLHYLIKAHPTKSKTTVLQAIGRVLRLSPDGRDSVVIDIVDDLQTSTRKNFALKHAEERFRYYIQEKFDFTINKIKIRKNNV